MKYAVRYKGDGRGRRGSGRIRWPAARAGRDPRGRADRRSTRAAHSTRSARPGVRYADLPRLPGRGRRQGDREGPQGAAARQARASTLFVDPGHEGARRTPGEDRDGLRGAPRGGGGGSGRARSCGTSSRRRSATSRRASRTSPGARPRSGRRSASAVLRTSASSPGASARSAERARCSRRTAWRTTPRPGSRRCGPRWPISSSSWRRPQTVDPGRFEEQTLVPGAHRGEDPPLRPRLDLLMAHSYTVRMPDGKEYGPADLEALQAWQAEGRIGPDTLVWRRRATRLAAPEPGPGDRRDPRRAGGRGDGDGGAAAFARRGVDPARPARRRRAGHGRRPGRSAEQPAAARARPAARPARRAAPRPSPLRIVVPLAVLVGPRGRRLPVVEAGQPGRDRRRAEASIRSFGMPDRRFADEGLGLRLDVPEGWIVLRPDNPLFHAPDARSCASPTRGCEPSAGCSAQAGPRGSPSARRSPRPRARRLAAPGHRARRSRAEATRASRARPAPRGHRGLVGRRPGACGAWSRSGSDGWNEFALAGLGPGGRRGRSEHREPTRSYLTCRWQARPRRRIRAAADAVAPDDSRAVAGVGGGAGARAARRGRADRRLAADQPARGEPRACAP